MANENSELEALRQEVETLRRTNGELKTKSASRKARVTELEAAHADMQTKLDAANGAIHEFRIGAPLRAMANEISVCPDDFVEAFGASYRLELVNDELTVVSAADGKPVTKDDQAVPFKRDALLALLTSDDHPRSGLFKRILIASRASGGGATGSGRSGGGSFQLGQSGAPRPLATGLGLR